MKRLFFLPILQKLLALILLAGLLFLCHHQKIVIADDEPEDRTITTMAESTIYQWWLVYWSDNSVACDFYIEHEGNPNNSEIQEKCSVQLYQSWFNSPPCENSSNSYSKKCTGLYLHLANTTPVQKEVEITFAPPSVRLSLSSCEYQGNQGYCTGNPSLTFTGLEPIPDEQIVRIHGILGDSVFNCDASECVVPLTTAGLAGIKIKIKSHIFHNTNYWCEKYS